MMNSNVDVVFEFAWQVFHYPGVAIRILQWIVFVIRECFKMGT